MIGKLLQSKVFCENGIIICILHSEGPNAGDGNDANDGDDDDHDDVSYTLRVLTQAMAMMMARLAIAETPNATQ